MGSAWRVALINGVAKLVVARKMRTLSITLVTTLSTSRVVLRNQQKNFEYYGMGLIGVEEIQSS